LAEAISNSLGLISWVQDSFAYADGWDEQSQRYRGLQVGRRIRVSLDGGGLLVKPEVARAQLAQQEEPHDPAGPPSDVLSAADDGAKSRITTDETAPSEAPKSRRFHGSVV
jgi:hypothetical protein